VKILFLDIDGVLNSLMWYKAREDNRPHHSYFERYIDEIDPHAIKLLSDFIGKYSDLKVVISSSWRILHTNEEIQNVFDTVLPHNNIDIIGATIQLRRSHCRGDEIKEWLSRHKDVRNYVIMDDDGDMLSEQMKNFVNTNWSTGLLLPHIRKAQRILGVSNVREKKN
jgi:hypothetical protein